MTREINLPEDGLEEMLIDPTVYVFGLADVAGEIMRFTTSTIGNDLSRFRKLTLTFLRRSKLKFGEGQMEPILLSSFEFYSIYLSLKVSKSYVAMSCLAIFLKSSL